MKQYKVCFWLNVPSNHQTLFMEALDQDDRIDLQVRYFDKPSDDRLKMGWRDGDSLHEYEEYINEFDTALESLKDWKERIHIVIGYSYPFNRKLIPIFIKNHVKWVHWSERYGIGLAQRLNYNISLFKLLRPLFLLTKRSYGKLVNKNAFGCFAQGELARRDFIGMGIDNNKIENLYYTTAPLTNVDETPKVLNEFPYKYKFLYTGRLNNRKGVEDLLIAFSGLVNADYWGLVLLGNDETDGYFQQVSKEVGIDNKVLFVGGVKADEVSAFFSAADVFVLPSRYDGWGAVVNEAASLGLPIITSDQTGAAFHLVENGKNGYIVGAGDKDDLTVAMQNYVSNNELLSQHGNYSKELFKNFSPEKNVERFISAILKWEKL